MNNNFSIETIYGDEHILAVNKPAGLPTLRDGYIKDAPYLIELLEQQFDRLWIVHRLDKDTSGVVLFARSAEAHKALNVAFETRQVAKIYHAIVMGVPEWEELTIELPLLADGDRKHRTIVDRIEGKYALTRCRVLEKFAQHSLIEAKPETGRTHQIRSHLLAQGFPILGDPLYGRARSIDRGLIDRSALHARSIAFQHPINQRSILIEAKYPIDFDRTLNQLRSA